MHITVYSTRPYDRQALEAAAGASSDHRWQFLEARLDALTAIGASESQAVCVFVNDVLDRAVLAVLQGLGVRLVVLRCAGFNHVDIRAATDLGLALGRVPAYSPYAVAEHTLALLLTLNRKIHRAYARVREGNFALDGLLGFDIHGRTVGVVGTGKIGQTFCQLMTGFGCTVLAHDLQPNPASVAMGVRYVAFAELLARSDVVSLHCPLTPKTHHLMDALAFSRMKPGAYLLNTSRGAVIDTPAAIAALKSGTLGALGLDVYEEEGDLFFRDLSNVTLQDDVFARLLTFPNVLVTGHQAFFTQEALADIARVTLSNIDCFARTGQAQYPVLLQHLA
jgi:D-lactate dehydrogenase